MNKLDLNKVKEMTNNKIGYDCFMNEEHRRTKAIKRTIMTFSIIMFMCVSLVTVNALTDNGIVKLFTGKATINGQEQEVKSYIQINYTGEAVPGDGPCGWVTLNPEPHNVICVESEEANLKTCINDAKEITKVEMNYDEKTKHPTDCTITYIDINDQEQKDYIDMK